MMPGEYRVEHIFFGPTWLVIIFCETESDYGPYEIYAMTS